MALKALAYSCSGCSSAAQMANEIAVQLDRKGVVEMSCIAGVGGGAVPLVKKAKTADVIIGIDGCPLACVKACLAKEGLKPTIYYELSEMGVKKNAHKSFDSSEAKSIECLMEQDLKESLELI